MNKPSTLVRPGEGFSPLLSGFASPVLRKRKKRRAWRPLPAVERSARLYVYIDHSKVHLFRFFLETEENLGIMTVVDRWRAALLVRFSPHQTREMLAFLEAVRPVLDLRIIGNFCCENAMVPDSAHKE